MSRSRSTESGGTCRRTIAARTFSRSFGNRRLWSICIYNVNIESARAPVGKLRHRARITSRLACQRLKLPVIQYRLPCASPLKACASFSFLSFSRRKIFYLTKRRSYAAKFLSAGLTTRTGTSDSLIFRSRAKYGSCLPTLLYSTLYRVRGSIRRLIAEGRSLLEKCHSRGRYVLWNTERKFDTHRFLSRNLTKCFLNKPVRGVRVNYIITTSTGLG